MENLFILIISILISLAVVGFSKRMALRFEIGSLPNPRKIHKEFVPLLGGLGIFAGLIAAVLSSNVLNLFSWEIWTKYPYFWAGLGIILLTGILDDIFGLNSVQKFTGEILAAVSLVMGGCLVEAFAAPGGASLKLGIFSYPFTILWIILVINAINLLDGLDGLAGGVSMISLLGFAVIAYSIGQIYLVILALAIIGGIIGFLKYNYHPASIFMGDVGSLQLGYILAFFSIETLKIAGSHQVYFLSSLIILGVPITDTLISFFRRLGKGEHPFKADKEHIHHRLINLGLSHLQTVWLIYLFAIMFTAIGVLMIIYTEFIGVMLFIFGFGFALFLTRRLGYLEARQAIPVGFNQQEKVIPLQPLFFWNRIWHQVLVFCGDLIALNLALYLTIWFKFKSGFFQLEAVRPATEYLSNPVFLVFTIGWTLLFWLNGLYNMPWDISRFDKTIRVSKIITFGIIILGLILLDTEALFSESQLYVLLFYWIALLVLVNGMRLLIIDIEKKLHIFEYSFKNSLIIGINRKARNIIRDIRSNPHLLYRVKGIIDKKKRNNEFEGYPVLGEYKDLPEIIRHHKIQEVIIAIGESSKEDLLRLIGMCDQMGVVIKTLPGLHKFVSGHHPELAGHFLVRVFPESMMMWQWIIKRFFDYVFVLGNLIILSPVWIALAVWIKLHFKKSVLVKIPALGKHGNVFHMLLFRMSFEDYDYHKNGIYLGNRRPGDWDGVIRLLYMTRVYKFPLLFNILKGDMTLVGPRPEPVEWYQEHYTRLKFLHRRLIVRPGFTGLAQVKYRYEHSQKKIQERINYDIFYIENLSLNLDLRVIIRSIFLFFTRPTKKISAA